MKAIIDKEFYVWIAPDGEIQLGFIAEDEASCHLLAKLFSRSGLGKSPHRMKQEGFTIQKVKLSILEAIEQGGEK